MATRKGKEVFDALTMFAVGSGGAIVSSWLLNFTPGIKAANPATRSLIQLGIGMGTMLIPPGRLRLLRGAGLGIAWAGALGATERLTRMKTLAGNPESTLSASEIAALQSMGYLPLMRGPVDLRNPMSGPATMQNMGAEKPSMMGAFKAPT